MRSKIKPVMPIKDTQPDLAIFRPLKVAISLRIDADVLAWLKSQGDGYQSRINGLLRNAMNEANHKKTGN